MVQIVLGQWLMLWFLQELNEALSLCWFLDLADVRRLQVCVCVSERIDVPLPPWDYRLL